MSGPSELPHDAPPPGGLVVWMGWRLRVLMAFALASCVAVFLLMRWLAASPDLPLRWLGPDADGRPLLAWTGAAGVPLTQLRAADGQDLLPPVQAQLPPRWQASEDARHQQMQWRRTLQRAAAAGALQATLADGRTATIATHARGLEGLGVWFWLLVSLALMQVLLGAVAVLAQPHPSNALYALMTWAQALALVQQALMSLPGLWVHPRLLALDLPTRGTLDLLAVAALMHVLVVFPRRQPRWRRWAGLAWGVALLTLVAAVLAPWHWALLQGGLLLLMGTATALAWHSAVEAVGAVRRQARLLLSLGLAALLLLTLLAIVVARWPGSVEGLLSLAVVLWPLWITALFVVPLLLRSRQVLREFALLASISVVAASLDLLFVAVFSLSAFNSLALVVFIALGLYAGLRQWLFDRLTGGTALTTERVFEQLYRAARVVQADSTRMAEQLTLVLRELFEPLEVLHSARPVATARVAGGGGTLLVPSPSLAETPPVQTDDGVPRTSPGPRRGVTLVLRHARRGQRVFTLEDARLADRLVEQLRRAVIYDLAVERGRSEERLRIAQDLHDDIGARLLTLMYQAPDRAMEDYIRHTLKDLKTLSRGLAAGDQLLSHAMAEWRADIDQRCAAAHVELDWAVQVDRDVRLGMVAWSGLTRVLRELVSNTLQHAKATRLTVRLRLLEGAFSLRVGDDGHGEHPERWAHGLGLGGVRKRVKLLGGSVQWRQVEPHGTLCEVRIANFGSVAAAPN